MDTPDPPAAVFFYSPDRGGEHPEQHLAGYAGLMQADAYAGFGRLYEANRKPGPIVEAACWAHGRRKFTAQQGADRGRGGQAHRCPVCHRA
jgi:transposase